MSRLDELVEFNEQLLELRRAGWALPHGLFPRDVDPATALGRINATFTRQSVDGVPLEQILAAEEHSLPPVYRGLLQLGIQSERMVDALACLSETTSATQAFKRQFIVALIYPTLVIVLALALLTFTAYNFLPQFGEFLRQNELDATWLASCGQWFHEHLPRLAVLGAVALLAAVIFVIKLRRVNLWSASTAALTGSIPILHELSRWRSLAGFARLSGRLIRRGHHATDAYRCAAEISGLTDSSLDFRPGAAGDELLRNVSPLLHWVSTSSSDVDELPLMLEQIGDAFDVRVQQRCKTLVRYIPLILVVVVGGTLTVVYMATVIAVLMQLLNRLM